MLPDLLTLSLCLHLNSSFRIHTGWHVSLDPRTCKYNLASNPTPVIYFNLVGWAPHVSNTPMPKPYLHPTDQQQLVNLIKFIEVISTFTCTTKSLPAPKTSKSIFNYLLVCQLRNPINTPHHIFLQWTICLCY